MSDPRMLAILETGHREANEALMALKAQWARDDEETRERRKGILEAHAQGARDRDAKRVELGGQSLIEAERLASEEAAAKRLAAADVETKRLADARAKAEHDQVAMRDREEEAKRQRLEQEAIARTKPEVKVAPVPADPPRTSGELMPGGEARTGAAPENGQHAINVKPAEAVRAAEMPEKG